MEKLGNKHQEWLAERKNYIGGSEIGAILGVSSYSSALDVYLDKITPEVEAQTDSDAMYWGRNLEDVVLKEYALRTGTEVTSSTRTLYHPDYPFLACNIDGWVSDGVILECKTAGARMANTWGEQGTDEIPESYLCQVAFYCAITGATRADIAVLIGGQDFRIYTYHENKDFQDKLIQAAVNFWQGNVLKKIAPPVKSVEGLAKLYNVSNEKPIEADEDLVALVAEVKEMQLMKKDLEDDIKEGQFKIQDFMRDYDVLKDDFNNTIATWKNRKKSNKFDAKKFQIDLPNIYKDYLKESASSRTFLIK